MTIDLVDLISRAQSAGAIIATAESCTGGLVAAALTETPGSSAVFDRGFVTYSNQAKMDLLGVSPATLNDFGAVSPETAAEMAQGAIHNSKANIAVSITGIAGPGGSDHKPEGRVCFGLSVSGHPTQIETIEFTALGRQNVREEACKHALELVNHAIATFRSTQQ